MLYSGIDPESYITKYTGVYEDCSRNPFVIRCVAAHAAESRNIRQNGFQLRVTPPLESNNSTKSDTSSQSITSPVTNNPRLRAISPGQLPASLPSSANEAEWAATHVGIREAFHGYPLVWVSVKE